MTGAAPAVETARARTVTREFFCRILPLALLAWTGGVICSYWQHGFLIGGARGVPLAGPGVDVGLWHLLLLGFVGGYIMALVGNATGLVSLPYSMSVLGFTALPVSPTVQLETLLNPIGALLGFRRNGQWNGDFAIPLCAGAVGGGLIGPIIRVRWLADPIPFKAAVGVALLFVATQMLWRVIRGPGSEEKTARVPLSVREERMMIRTVRRTWRYLELAYGEDRRGMSVPGLVLLGCGVGILSTALGVGGGFLLVPILAEVQRLPMRVIVAGSIPYVIVLSAVSLFAFNVTVPAITGERVSPEWAWGLFTGGAAILGSWYATHSQRHIPDRTLRIVLGGALAAAGVLYVLGYFGLSPIRS